MTRNQPTDSLHVVLRGCSTPPHISVMLTAFILNGIFHSPYLFTLSSVPHCFVCDSHLPEAATMVSLPSLFRRHPSHPVLELQKIPGSAIIEGSEYVPKPQKLSRKRARNLTYYPDVGQIEDGADIQPQSRFFTKLPAEVRQMIYRYVWALSGLTQHIYIANGSYTHCPCIIDHSAPDERQTKLQRLWPELNLGEHTLHCSESAEWRRRLVSPWCNHWPCEEAAACNATSAVRPCSPFLPMLLTSRKM